MLRLILRPSIVFLGAALLTARPAAALDPIRSPTGWTVTAGDMPHRHTADDPLWQDIAAHLPDPATASAERMELQGDVLRARRYPEDALDYYQFALERGGNKATLWNKIGVCEISMQRFPAARLYFLRVLKLSRNNPEAWNNLGAVEYLQGRFGSAIGDYRKAVKFKKDSAVFHSNLGLALFDQKDYSGARREIAEALRIDPAVLQASSGAGVTARVMTESEKARFSFEMASLHAHRGDIPAMLEALRLSAELGGLDVRREMRDDPALASFANDPRVIALIQQATLIRNGGDLAIAGIKIPGNPAPTPR